MTGARILLVEDDDALAELLTWHLRREGHNVEQTADGESGEAVEEITVYRQHVRTPGR